MKSITLTSLCLSTLASAYPYPGEAPNKATSNSDGKNFTLENSHLQATWQLNDGQLRGPHFTNKISKEDFVADRDLFAIATQKQILDPDRVYVGIRKNNEIIEAVISSDGKSWEPIASYPMSTFGKSIKAIRVGKTSSQGKADDYSDAGELGSSEFQRVAITDSSGKRNDLTSKPQSIHKSKREGTKLSINNELIRIDAHANSATYAEYAGSNDWQLVSCRIKKASDKGLSWGPGVTVIFDDDSYILANIRGKDQYTIRSGEGEKIVTRKTSAALDCDLKASSFTLSSPAKLVDLENGKAITATFLDKNSGLAVRWNASLRDGSNYIQQSYTIASSKQNHIFGLEFINGKLKGAQQIGEVPGSPAATSSLFFGVEMPFTTNRIDPDHLTSGFPCELPIDSNQKYEFKSVIGTYPTGQLRRAFNYYLERERSTPSHQFLHYNNWYDFAPSREAFLAVIEAFYQEMTVKRGVVLDSFVMDDGWDDYNAGLWEYHEKRFPNGFDEVSAASRKAKSNLGVWISPLGGYGGADQRTAHAKKMGLIEDTLDLSQPKYYQWFYEKCLGFMKDHGVNYYKWDKAGSGVSPHFMALIQCGRELKKYNPKLFINVTVGTWPSPFWLNHIDSTWRTGTGDVAWMGVGDEREQWLTFRDWGCYEKFVKIAPLYPLNSVMHHGLVVGRHYQATKVTKAGVNMKHAARSYFGTGANLLELYLTPELMTDSAWDQVAEAARWAKENEEILVDSHWVGGNPKDLCVYGWASWNPKKSVITLRNSADAPKELTLDLAQALEIPEGFSTHFIAKNAYNDQGFKEGPLSGDVTFKLQPFEVLCIELLPKK
ncbi:hypothetical protein [Rubritalea tangerina]|uniref:Enterotoxin n=1 Tax=Rubritalea tangerina TaxID=430798 RepID=A0ABW4Z8F5_9BACT